MDSNLKSNLTCPICLELYNDPVALHCMHSFCRDCLIEHMNSRCPPGTTDANKVQVPCPNCKKEFPLSRNGIRGMSGNFQLQNIVDNYKDSVIKPCDWCAAHSATKRCTKCEVSYCSECFNAHHPSRGPLATHSIIVLGGAGGATGGAKPKTAHREQNNTGNAEPIKAQLRQDLEHLTSEMERLKTSVGKLQRVKSSIEIKTKELTDGIVTESGKFRDIVTKTETEQVGAVMEESKQKMMGVEIQLREQREYLRKREDLMDSVRALLKEPDDNAFIKTAASVKQKVDNFKQSRPHLDTAPSDLSQNIAAVNDFKQRVQELMQGEKKGAPPPQPGLATDVCVCRSHSIAICIPPAAFVIDVEASKIDTYGYKYNRPHESEWKQGTVPACQTEISGCVKIASLIPSTQYNISIRAHNSFGWSPWSSTVVMKTSDSVDQPQVQKAPVTSGRQGAPRIDTTKTHVGSEAVILQWTPMPDMASDVHIIAYSSADDANENWIYSITQDSNSSFTISGLSPGSAYLFKLSGCSKDGFSDWSKKVKIKLGQVKLPAQQGNLPQSDSQRLMAMLEPVDDTSFSLDKQMAHPCLVITRKNIVHPSNACHSPSDGFSDSCYSVFGNATYSSGVHYWEVIIHGQGSKVRVGIAEPNVTMSKPLGICPDAWVLVMDARAPIDRQGSFVLHGNHPHKSGGKWIPFTNYIGIKLDYNQKEICYIVYEGPPSPNTKRVSHSFQFEPPPRVKPVFAIDDKTDNLRLQVITDTKPPGIPPDMFQETLFALLSQNL